MDSIGALPVWLVLSWVLGIMLSDVLPVCPRWDGRASSGGALYGVGVSCIACFGHHSDVGRLVVQSQSKFEPVWVNLICLASSQVNTIFRLNWATRSAYRLHAKAKMRQQLITWRFPRARCYQDGLSVSRMAAWTDSDGAGSEIRPFRVIEFLLRHVWPGMYAR